MASIKIPLLIILFLFVIQVDLLDLGKDYVLHTTPSSLTVDENVTDENPDMQLSSESIRNQSMIPNHSNHLFKKFQKNLTTIYICLAGISLFASIFTLYIYYYRKYDQKPNAQQSEIVISLIDNDFNSIARDPIEK